MDNFDKWVNEILSTGSLCDSYTDKLKRAKSNKQIMDLVLDANGVSYLQQMQEKGLVLPYEVITSRFRSFINGGYISEHKNVNGERYTSSMYCCYQGDIDVKSSLVALLGCKANIYVKENSVVQIYADRNCEISVGCPSSSKAIVHYWGNREPEYSGNVELIKE